MLVLGIILLLVAAGAAVSVATNGTSQEIEFTSTVGDVTTTPVWVFCAGALAMLLALIGIALIRRGTRRRVERRREIKRLRQVEQEHVSGPVPVTKGEPPAEDAPDRQLVREPQDTAGPVEPSTGAPPSAVADESARHREP